MHQRGAARLVVAEQFFAVGHWYVEVPLALYRLARTWRRSAPTFSLSDEAIELLG